LLPVNFVFIPSHHRQLSKKRRIFEKLRKEEEVLTQKLILQGNGSASGMSL
jgi:hypothetical protein